MKKEKMLCYGCGREILQGEEYFESYSGEHICEACGKDFYIHDYTQYDDYPYIDGEGTWDGSMWEGESYKRVEEKE
jgi:hypothetical protein